MRGKKIYNTLLVVIVTLLLVVALSLVIGFLKFSAHIQSAKLCSMINAGRTEDAVEYIEKVADVNEYSAPLWVRPLLNAVEDSPDLPLVTACEEGDLQVVKALLEHGADPNQYLDGNWSPMEATFISNNPDQLEIAKLLLQYGADVDAYGSHQSGLFHQLLSYMYSDGETELTKKEEKCILFLLDNGANPIDDQNNTIMHYVCGSGNVDFISMLTEDYGELLDYKNKRNETPLMWAINRKKEETVIFLLTHGVDVKAIDINGKSVLDYAYESDNQRIIALITEAVDSEQHTN